MGIGGEAHLLPPSVFASLTQNGVADGNGADDGREKRKGDEDEDGGHRAALRCPLTGE